MPKYSLEIRCQLENVGSFGPTDVQQFDWNIRFRCSGCSEERHTFRAVVIEKKYSQSGTRGEFHHVETCKFCGSSSTAEILEKEVPFAYGEDDSGSFKAVCSFDCRGIEPTDFDFGTGYTVSAAHSSQKFRDVDLTEKEWTDYDDEANEPVEVQRKIRSFWWELESLGGWCGWGSLCGCHCPCAAFEGLRCVHCGACKLVQKRIMELESRFVRRK